MFAESISGSPSPAAVATARAATDVVDGKIPLSRACVMYNVKEQSVIQFIIDSTEYDTLMKSKVKLDKVTQLWYTPHSISITT